MRRLLILSVSLVLLAGCGSAPDTAPSSDASGPRLTDVPTSPAGADSPSALPERLIQRGRLFRGNPPILGAITGAVLVVALGLGVYTLYLIHRDHRSGRL